MFKKVLSIILAISMVLSMGIANAFAADKRDLSMEEATAVQLKSLNLFKGVSETNFDLGRAPSRIEALVIMLRLLGKEAEILDGSYKHPFNDVPSWANNYVGYAYENGLTKGISATKFGTDNASAAQFMTFVLRAMDYSDSNGDFTWDNPFKLAKEIGVLDDSIVIDNGFLRADCGSICFNALSAKLKGGTKTLGDKLISEKVFTKDQYDKVINADNQIKDNFEKTIVKETETLESELQFVVNGTVLKPGWAYRASKGSYNVVVMRDGKVYTDYEQFDANNQPYTAKKNADGSLTVEYNEKGILNGGVGGTICVDMYYDEHEVTYTDDFGKNFTESYHKKANFNITSENPIKGITMRWHDHNLIPGYGFGSGFTTYVADVYCDGVKLSDYQISASSMNASIQADGSLLMQKLNNGTGTINISYGAYTANYTVYFK